MSPEKAAEFRRKWSLKMLNDLEHRKTQTTTYTEKHQHKYNYWTFGKMVSEFGGWKDAAARKGAATAAMKCIAMGPPFVNQHSQSEMTIFAIVEESWKDTFEKAWQETVTGRGAGASAPTRRDAATSGGVHETTAPAITTLSSSLP